MITLKTLTWSNLFSYAGNNLINLSEEPIVQLIGFNGHGKSSIPLILEETLFNKNSKGIKKGDVVNRLLDTNKYSSECVFYIDNKEYILSISRSGATQKVKLLEDAEDISSHTATGTFEQVQILLGLDFKTFSQLVYQNNNSSLQFLTATDANRKKFLIDLLSLDRYLVIFDRIKVAHKDVSDSLLKLRSKQDTINSWLKTAAAQVLEEKQLQPVPELNSKLTDDIVELKTRLSTIVEYNKKVSSNNLYREKINSINSSSLVCDKTIVDTKDIESRLTECKQRIRQELAVVRAHSNLTSGECPTCKQSIDKTKILSIIDSANVKVAKESILEIDLTKELSEAQLNNKVVESHQKTVAEFEKYSILIDSNLPDLLLDKKNLEDALKLLEVDLVTINSAIIKVSKLNSEASAHNAKISAIKDQLSEYTKSLSEVSLELEVISTKLSKLEILKKAFSTSGLIAYKIENSVKELEELTNGYLADLSDGRFELLFALANDKLNVVIVDNGKDIDITALSAGELARVTIATLLAIRKLMATLSKSKINVLFLDEVIDVLDMEGKERLIEVLLREEDLNTFLISHSYNHPLVKKLQIIKEDGISRIDYV